MPCSCSIIGQEVFQSGVFPGDTDFRVFRDYGRVPGLDLEFVQNYYWWHTEIDEARRTTSGSLQVASDNIYAILLYFLYSPYLDNPAEFGDQKNVFFDFLGLFVVVYSEGVANAVNAILVVAVVISTANHMRKHSDVQGGCHELRSCDCMYDSTNDASDIANLGCNALVLNPWFGSGD
ncbi:hypothetical protein Y032_0501g2591 [Ancylostoma ceylanicum]|uniref:Peptidase M28 domain-containing protein n=1 Tax=Ancylostoma ceylanicum TaxID=53326 RepID=A0A016WU14_9BILA|nr:hypothetical protein Y032_0501g2591 [Ancylostoma ceylanicum]